MCLAQHGDLEALRGYPSVMPAEKAALTVELVGWGEREQWLLSLHKHG